jgi:hypothetical protein
MAFVEKAHRRHEADRRAVHARGADGVADFFHRMGDVHGEQILSS